MLALERTAVHTALIGRVLLVRAHLDALERAEIDVAVMILAVLDGTADTVVSHIVLYHVITFYHILYQIPDIIIIVRSHGDIHRKNDKAAAQYTGVRIVRSDHRYAPTAEYLI